MNPSATKMANPNQIHASQMSSTGDAAGLRLVGLGPGTSNKLPAFLTARRSGRGHPDDGKVQGLIDEQTAAAR